MITHGSLFSGIGGFDLGFQWAGIKTIWDVEIEPYCQKVLTKNFPDTEIFSDVKEVHGQMAHAESKQGGRLQQPGVPAHTGTSCKRCLPTVDIISGGFPCQDISVAGKQAGITGARSGLWSEFHRIIGELRPRFAVIENVPNLARLGLDRVLADLASIGYDAEWTIISAADVGAPHLRKRIWIVAYPQQSGARGQPGAATVQRWLPAKVRGETLRQDNREVGPGGPDTAGEIMAHSTNQRYQRAGATRRRGDGLANSRETMAHPPSSGRQEDGSREPGRQTSVTSDSHRIDDDNGGHGAGQICRGQQQPAELSGSEEYVDDGRLSKSDWSAEPDVGRVAHGVPSRVDRLKGLGNAIVPQIAEIIGRRLVDLMTQTELL